MGTEVSNFTYLTAAGRVGVVTAVAAALLPPGRSLAPYSRIVIAAAARPELRTATPRRCPCPRPTAGHRRCGGHRPSADWHMWPPWCGVKVYPDMSAILDDYWNGEDNSRRKGSHWSLLLV